MITANQKIFFALSLFAAGSCFADWTGGIEAGASSNNNSTLRFFARNQADPLSHYIYVDYAGSSKYRVGYEPKFKVSHSIYSFGRFSLDEGAVSVADREIDAVVGIGNNLFQRGNTQIKVETGVGGRLLEFSDTEDEKDGFFFLSGNLSSSFLSLVKFDAALMTKAGSGQTTLDAEAGISIPIGPGTALSYVHNVKRYNFDDRPNIDDKDSFFKITYGF